ncbi:Transglycosylase-like domain protein [Bipolaris maydis]|uniref:Transglycosylase-like domain protein n=1 Tax=Cochliobolus heterostrophus TaxID=5016 RepID=UPI0024CF194A|nr:Transglycosylase-like domain protein [Bipolaris maydis]
MMFFNGILALAMLSWLSVVHAASGDFMQATVARTHTACRSEVHIATTPSSLPSSSVIPVVPNADYMVVVDKWRTKMEMKTLTHKRQLELNAMDTVTASKGVMIHKLNPGTFGQVLAPGDTTNFEHVFVGGWLCEKPETPGLDGVCQRESDGWDYRGQTGHAEILMSKDFSEIGCAHSTGIWCCDLA